MASIEFDEYTPRAQCVVSLIAALAIAERAIIRSRSLEVEPSLTWDGLLQCARNRAFRSGPKTRWLGEYFRSPVSEAAELNKKNPATTDRIAELVASVASEFYFRAGSPLAVAKQDLGEDLGRLADKLAKFRQAEHFLNLLKLVNPEDARQDECVRKLFQEAFGDASTICHPEFPSVRIFDLRAIKAEFHEVDGTEGSNWGLFAVIREAGGWAVRKTNDVNILLRDVLWLMPEEDREKEKKDIEDRLIGYYASTIDDDIFIIEDADVEELNIITLKRLDDPGNRQRCKLIFADFKHAHPLQVRNGIIAGRTQDEEGGPFFGAWKAVFIRPDWDDRRLKTLLYQYGRCEVNMIKSLLIDANVMGVLFSDKLRSKIKEVQVWREAFRLVVANDPDLMDEPAENLENFFT